MAAASPSIPPEKAAFDREYASAGATLNANPQLAIRRAGAARRAAAAFTDPAARRTAEASADWVRAEAFISFNRPADAAAIAGGALAALGPVESPVAADLLRARGFADAMLGRVEAALADFHHAFTIFARAGDRRHEALTLQDIAALYGDAGDYPHVLRYYRQSAELGVSDPSIQLAASYNAAVALGKMGRLRESEVEFRRALAAARAIGNTSYEVRTLTELAEAEVRLGRLAEADRVVASALVVAGHDRAAGGWRPLILGVAASAALAEGRTEQAARDLARAFRGIDTATTDLSYRDLHEVAVEVYRARGDYRLAFANLEALKRLDAQAQTLASNTNAALMSARFDFQNQDLKIARLQAGQLAQAVQLEHARTQLHRTVFAITAVLGSALLALLSVALASTRRSRNRLAAVNAELSQSNEALTRALTVKTEFLATTSHEIRTPLNGILGMTQVLLAGHTLEPGVRERIEVVHGAGHTMRALVDDILDVAKLESGRLEIQPAPTSLAGLFADAARLWGAEAERKQLIFRSDLGTAPDAIVADEQRLRQILFNLLSNAIKFTDRGNVAMLAVALGDAGAETLEITVEDTGIGIAPDMHEAIFESFRQADGGTTRRFGGTGLGLTICRRLAAAMGGTVTVASEAGQGARFTLRLPLVRAAPVAPTPACVEGSATSLDCSRLLLVEKNPLNRGILNALLQPACSTVVNAASREEALAPGAAAGIDLVLADAATLAGDGGELAGAIAGFAPCPVVLLVPAATIASDPGLAASGAAQLIAKPVAGADLIAQLSALYPRRATTPDRVAVDWPMRSAAR